MKTIAKTNASNFPKPSKSIRLKSLYHTTLQTTIDLHNIDSAKCKKKMQTNKN